MITLFGKNMCESCFAENDKDPCEKCGFSSADYRQDSTALPIGQKLQERYLIGGVIGKGGFGITYTAFDTKLERRVAIKEYYPYGLALRTPGTTMVSAPDADGDSVFDKGAEKFYDEARLVAKFSDNQNIVSIYDFFYENNTVYYIMEYLQGQSMKKYVEKHGVVSAEQAVYIAKEVSNALVSSHSANVLHRDIAPDNIILCNNGKVKLIDFGAARQVISEGSQSLSVILKQGFAPLEQYQKKGKQGPWTDIYALGATIYYLTTGELLNDPMTRMDDDDEFSSNMYNLNEELWNVIKKATMLKPADRYKDIFEFRDDLNNIGIGSVPLTISYDSPSGSGVNAPVGATMPAKEASPVGATMPAKEASPVGATMPAKEASPIGATMPVKEASPIGATMPIKEASPIGATMPVKEASPIGATMPAKEASPIGATMPVKEQPPQKSGIFVETDADGDEKSYQSAAAVAEQLSKKKKMRLIIGLGIICVIAIIIYICYICVYFSTHVKIGDSWYRYSSGVVDVFSEEVTDLSKLAKKTSIRRIHFDRCTFPDPSVLEELKNMEKLYSLSITNSSSFSNISALKDMTGLNNLNLNYNKISDISALSGLTNLEELYMFTSKDSKITDLSPLKKLTNLETLYLTYNGEDYRLTTAAEVKDFLDKNVKTTAAAEPKEEKPAVTEKPAETEPAKSKIVTEEYTDGSVYVGEIKNGKRNGYGTMTYSNGDVYEGEWKDGVMHGQGTYTYSDGDVYEGEWKNDKMNGQGTYKFGANSDYAGDVYEGEWKNDKMNGQGTYTFSHGDVYEGEWKDDGVMHGQGTYTFSDGGVYEGEWKDGVMHGQGTYTFSDGDVYKGEFKNEQRDGYGTYKSSDGWVYEGEWKNDQMNGQGTYTFKDGTVLKGTFKDGEWVG